ncbi:uncharacterized protein VICG_00655 [Vittaforma corneae ATCC 50505]|uniref:Amino acid transporter transmembrane domain-containing protein n=1 Tax=Vittaforma corneae (strain ATCC 50505) TaxID=993615 RepID=L2GN51_VITCO|nr:uncharacterized protein VICG_00655 [Vittaforma corneae ATCC 50505]ELA42256.1 hypothetical protein VICG_00655 [Vittaforma corneae ATCC 50505]
MLSVGLLTFFSTYSLSYVSTLTKERSDEKTSYSDLAAKFSKKLRTMVSMSLVVNSLVTSFSFTQTFLRIFLNTLRYNEYLNTLLDEKAHPVNCYIARALILLIICSIYFYVFQLDNLASLSFFSQFSLFTAIFFSAVISLYGLFNPVSNDQMSLPASESGLNLVDPLGAVIFALHCQFSYLDIFNSMKDTSLENVRNVTAIASIFATVLYGSVGFLGFKAVGAAVGNDPVIFHFASSSSSIVKDLTERYGIYLGGYLPKLLHSMFCPIFFSGNIFNMFSITPILQNWLSIKGKPASRSTIAFLACAFLFVGSVKPVENLGSVFSIAGFLLTTPLSFLFPALFVICASSKLNIMTVGSGIVICLSVAIMIGLTLMKLNWLPLLK